MTVTGDADPYEIIVRIRKAGKHAEVVSIGPPPAPPQKQDAQKKPEGNKRKEEAQPSEYGSNISRALYADAALLPTVSTGCSGAHE